MLTIIAYAGFLLYVAKNSFLCYNITIMDYQLSAHGTREPVPNAADIANADPGLFERAHAYLSSTACEAVSPGTLRRIYAMDGGNPADVGLEAAATVLYALHEKGAVGPPDPTEVGSWAMNLTIPKSSVFGAPQQ